MKTIKLYEQLEGSIKFFGLVCIWLIKFFGLIFIWATVEIEFGKVWCMGGMGVLLFYHGAILHYYYGRYYYGHSKEKVCIKMKFNGNINELTEAIVCEVGAKLQNKVGDYYVYGTNFKFAKNFNFLARECGSFCEVILGEDKEYRHARKRLGLQHVTNIREEDQAAMRGIQ